jgi:hypothetical protein
MEQPAGRLLVGGGALRVAFCERGGEIAAGRLHAHRLALVNVDDSWSSLQVGSRGGGRRGVLE